MEKKGKKLRIDRLIVEHGLAPSRERAQSLVMAGCVLANETPVTKPGQLVDPAAVVRIRGEDHPYVGRGGLKLAHALAEFGIDARGKSCMDVGASTGGFTDCLLKNGAAKVYAVDVGYGQLAWEIRQDPRVISIERTNIRSMERDLVPDAIELAVIDVSFISLSIVLPAVFPFLAPGASVVALVKPQFEVGRELVGRGGIVRDPASHELAVEKVRGVGERLGLGFEGAVESPIKGTKGNREFLLHFRRR